MPIIVAKSISILSDAGLGMAMFSLGEFSSITICSSTVFGSEKCRSLNWTFRSGLFMATQPKIIACGYSVAAASMGVRFFFGPAIMAAASAAVGIRGTLLRIAIVQVSRCLDDLWNCLVFLVGFKRWAKSRRWLRMHWMFVRPPCHKELCHLCSLRNTTSTLPSFALCKSAELPWKLQVLHDCKLFKPSRFWMYQHFHRFQGHIWHANSSPHHLGLLYYSWATMNWSGTVVQNLTHGRDPDGAEPWMDDTCSNVCTYAYAWLV